MRLPQAPLLRVPPAAERQSDEADLAEPGIMDEGSLRGALEDIVPSRDRGSHDDEAHAEGVDHDDAPLSEPATPMRRKSRVALTMGVLVAVGAVSGGAALWVLKGAPGLPKTPPVIMAADGPTKVQPPSQETISSPSDSASVLLKDQANKPVPVKLVNNQEQPVELQQVTATPASVAPAAQPVLAMASAAAAPVESAAPAPAPSPVVPPAPAPPTRSIALTTVGPTTAPPAAPSPFPEPKRVKTVSVRPDGSVISTGSEPVATADAAASAAAPAATAAAVDAAAAPAKPPVPRARPSLNAAANGAPQPATPKVDLPTKLAPPKSTARVPVARTDTTVPVAKTDAAAPASASQSPDTPLTAVPSFFNSVTKAVTGQPEQQQVASADPVTTSRTPAAASSGGGYAVQLAAPPSQKEAEGVSARLQAKYSAELAGMAPTIHQADSNGKSIWRVRLSGMSKAEAVSLCQKLKASGGDGACFVAKD
jgi:sporulation related protein